MWAIMKVDEIDALNNTIRNLLELSHQEDAKNEF
jgi:hypothetical protein